MSQLRKDAGQMLIAGIEGKTLPASVAQSLAEEELAGLILFRRNLGSIEEIVELTTAIHSAGAQTPFVAIDQEGGAVQRIKAPLNVWPPMLQLAEKADANLVALVAEALCDEIAWLGFNLNFAPVADIHTNDDNPIIGNRAFGRDAHAVERYAGAFAAGMTIAGVMPCAKHFPGHGDTHLDSHLELPVMQTPFEVMKGRELHPFAALIRANIPMIMTAHIRFPELDAEHPATLSSKIISELLRIQYRYEGIVVSDDLNMRALADHYSMEEMITLGVRAGIDLFLVCEHEDKRIEAYEALVRLGESSSLDRRRIAQSAERVRKARQIWLKPWKATQPILDQTQLAAHYALLQQHGLLPATS